MNQADAQIGSAGHGADVRVILVGRTGLDARLRLDPGVELVRVKNRVEAVGELSEPFNGGGRSVVIVGEGQEPEGEFMDALRSLDPRVRVLGVGEPRPGLDGAVRADEEAEVLRRIIRGGTPTPHEAPTEAGTSDEPAPRVEAQASPEAATHEDAGDAALVRLMLTGQDLTEAAIQIVRERLGRDDAAFVLGQGPSGAPVTWRGRIFGALECQGIETSVLSPHAGWLGAWMALRDQHVQLRDAAFVDSLTGAYNRRYFDLFLSSVLEQAQDQRRAITVLVFDVDDLKTFNDRYGHAAGDLILKETVRLLQSVIRPSDRVCRIGGDEFAVVFHDPEGPRSAGSTPPKSVSDIALRFQREVAGKRFPKLGLEAPGTLTVSGGLSTYPWDGRTPDELLAAADERAMRSKREGKNVIRFGPGAGDVCGDTP